MTPSRNDSGILCEEPLAATVSLQDAARQTWDAVVAGAGPAGSVLALLLARRGLAVLLAEKAEFPRDKVCGSCLNGAALGALDAVGLGDIPKNLGAVPLTCIRYRSGGREAVLELPRGGAVSRRAFDLALAQAAVAAGAAFLPRTEAVVLPDARDTRTVELGQGGERVSTSARFAVAADGLGGGFLKRIETMAPRIGDQAPMGMGAVIDDTAGAFAAGTIYIGCSPEGYIGVVRLEDGRIDLAAALDRGAAQQAGGSEAAAVKLLEQSGLPRPSGIAEALFRGTPYLTRRRPHVASEGLIAIGDAAGYVEPLTGEGMSWAIQQAILAAPLVCDAISQSQPALAHAWQGRWERFYRQRRGICLATTWMRRHSRFGSLVVRVLAHLPGLAAPWVRAVNRVSPEVLMVASQW